MEASPRHPTPSRASSTSAVDLTGTAAGIAASAPSSPALIPDDAGAKVTRRRSWGRSEVRGQDPLHATAQDDPLHIDIPADSSTTGLGTAPTYGFSEVPFYSPTDDPAFFHGTAYGGYPLQRDRDSTYTTANSAASTASLIMDGQREDDEAGLAANASGAGWDTEASGSTPRAQRRTVRYSVSPSPLRKTGTAIKSVSRNLRRASLRVVNLAGQGLESQIRLPDGNGDEPASAAHQKQEQDDAYDDQIPDLTKALPIRGRTLGFLGTDSQLRLNLYRMLVYPCVTYQLC